MKRYDLEAEKLFKEGYNCSQAVVMAFEDLFLMDKQDLLMMSSSFGGGFSRLREICGAVSAMGLIIGYLFGYSNTTDKQIKDDYYLLIQNLVNEFKKINGSYVCCELLKDDKLHLTHISTPRDESFFTTRPCLKCIKSACNIIVNYLLNNETIKIDYLPNHKEKVVAQHVNYYHFNTDTSLLGEFINIKEGLDVLDVGTNNGALLLYLSEFKPNRLIGIDINQTALKMAKLTLSLNNIEASLIAADFKTYLDYKKFDVIISNPPYFKTQDEKEKNINENIKMARHEHFLTLDDLINSFANNLKSDGKIFMIHRPNRLEEIKTKLAKKGLYINQYQLVYDFRIKEPISVLLNISFDSSMINNKLEDKIINGV